jgi:hypothetical protein
VLKLTEFLFPRSFDSLHLEDILLEVSKLAVVVQRGLGCACLQLRFGPYVGVLDCLLHHFEVAEGELTGHVEDVGGDSNVFVDASEILVDFLRRDLYLIGNRDIIFTDQQPID